MKLRYACLAAFLFGGALMVVVSPSSAQPQGKDSLKRLEVDLESLREQIRQLQGKLNKAEPGEKQNDKKESERQRGRKGGFGSGQFDSEKLKELVEQFKKKGGNFDPEKLKELAEQFKKKGGDFDPEKLKELAEQFKKKGGFGKGGFGKGGFGKGGFGKEFKKKDGEAKKEPEKEAGSSAKLDPKTIKEKYEYYKGLYEKLQKEESPKSKTPDNSIEARLDRLTRELESLRNELRKKK